MRKPRMAVKHHSGYSTEVATCATLILLKFCEDKIFGNLVVQTWVSIAENKHCIAHLSHKDLTSDSSGSRDKKH